MDGSFHGDEGGVETKTMVQGRYEARVVLGSLDHAKGLVLVQTSRGLNRHMLTNAYRGKKIKSIYVGTFENPDKARQQITMVNMSKSVP